MVVVFSIHQHYHYPPTHPFFFLVGAGREESLLYPATKTTPLSYLPSKHSAGDMTKAYHCRHAHTNSSNAHTKH